MSFSPWSRPQPTPAPTANSDPALSTAAIVMIVVGAYLALVTLVLVIRQCLKVSTRFSYNSYHLKQRHRLNFAHDFLLAMKLHGNIVEMLTSENCSFKLIIIFRVCGWNTGFFIYIPSSPLPMEGKICDRVCLNIISRKVTTFWTPLMQFSEVPTINNGVLEFGLPQWGFRLCVE